MRAEAVNVSVITLYDATQKELKVRHYGVPNLLQYTSDATQKELKARSAPITAAFRASSDATQKELKEVELHGEPHEPARLVMQLRKN